MIVNVFVVCGFIATAEAIVPPAEQLTVQEIGFEVTKPKNGTTGSPLEVLQDKAWARSSPAPASNAINSVATPTQNRHPKRGFFAITFLPNVTGLLTLLQFCHKRDTIVLRNLQRASRPISRSSAPGYAADRACASPARRLSLGPERAWGLRAAPGESNLVGIVAAPDDASQ